MLKKRIVAVLVVKDGIVVQSVGFDKYLPIGKAEIAVEFLNQWGVDEIVYNDISATKEKREINLSLIKNLSKRCFTPLLVGGGIKSVKDVSNCIKNGADKILVNSLLQSSPEVVLDMIQEFGSQCIIASIDIKRDSNGVMRAFNYIDKSFLPYDLFNWVKKVEKLGVGEMLINSVDRDGSYSGFEMETIGIIKRNTSIPIVALGGAVSAICFHDLFESTDVDAGAAANLFHFSEHSVAVVKSQLKILRSDIRLDTEFDYIKNSIDKKGRLSKRSNETLEELLFLGIEDEII